MTLPSRLPSAFRTYTPALARHICRRAKPSVRATRFFETFPPNLNIINAKDPSTSKYSPDASIFPVVGAGPYEASRTRPYTFHIGTSWAGKPEHPDDMKKIPFPPDTTIGAWRDKMLQQSRSDGVINTPDPGEDFFFVQEMRNNSGVSFGVADGVGGWVESGVDPALFSQALMYHAHRYSRNAWAGEPEIDPLMDYEEREQVEGWEMTPYECLDLAYGGVLREKYVQAGSSTACIISLNASSGVLRSANLGDSGYSILRGTTVIHQQRSQTHFFNCPKSVIVSSDPVLNQTLICEYYSKL
ncbi:hypothetical protein D9613_003050 [Agrocybe pediades]|uniref:Protein phosphatase n=1 Tax=Agrocybe pediades TaxID=84607 RepID=A0A8H4VMS8_9AGAR|nr:hypothetical protein D9613_003050 [Agrocybe pediades]